MKTECTITNRLVAVVAVEKTFFNLESDYDYYIPAALSEQVKLGSAVTVPFGKGNVLRKGIVVKIYTAINDSLKEILSVDSIEPLLTEEMVALSFWLKERCFCTTYDALLLMLPRGYGEIGSAGKKMAVLLIEDETQLPKLTSKQRTVTNLLFDIGSASIEEIKSFCSVGESVIKNLEKNGVLRIYKREIYRNPFGDVKEIGDRSKIMLSHSQRQAYDVYSKMLNSGGGYGLLFGVTGSGKTLVYLRLIDDTLDMGRDVIVMVPEISLTPQMLDIFHHRYGKQVAVFHSGLSMGERNDEYKRAKRGEVKIVIGTRSAVFAPLSNLGLIIIDEEQENTYKSERTPRYHARDVAKFRAKWNSALLLMTSATPSIESYSNAKNGRYVLCELNERFGEAKLPKVITVDMKTEIASGNRSPISDQLKELMMENLECGKQTILLINRRGYNTFIACNDCGHVITCPHCSISLTYHSHNNRLMCHYCGYTAQLEHTCPECKGDGVRYSGYGTQRIEDEISMAIPDARVLRIDADTTSTKFSHQKLFASFKNHEYDIMVGTQMVAKGLDFNDVTLVGVVNADNSLYDENYNSQERCFDLITQVIGRSGRRDGSGQAVIQTINPYNQTLEYAAKQDYKSFFEMEIASRRILIYPPYCDIYSASFTGDDENKVALCAKAFFDLFVELNNDVRLKCIVLGPSPAKISKISNNYRYRLAIKCKNSKKIRNMLSKILKNLYNIKEYRDICVTIDLNPNELA